MDKKQVIQKIREIIAKDKSLNATNIEIIFRDKKHRTNSSKKKE